MMKRAVLAATALLSSTIISTPLLADTIPSPTADAASQDTLDEMQSRCDAIAAGMDTDGVGTGDIWSAEVIIGAASLIAGPTEVANTRDIDETSIEPDGIYVPSVLEIRGNPVRNGGSVNMFGDQYSTAGYYPNSTYDYDAQFDATFAHAFDCEISKAVHVPEHTIPGQPVQGYYDNPGGGDCRGITPAHNKWGEDIGACEFIWQGPATDPQFVPEDWEDPVVVTTVAGTPVNQDQTTTLTAFEDQGGRLEVTGERFESKVVICISPGSKGGSWRAQNGYSGGSFSGTGTPPAPGCNTPYFKVAPIPVGSTTSNGTFISVPQYNLP